MLIQQHILQRLPFTLLILAFLSPLSHSNETTPSASTQPLALTTEQEKTLLKIKIFKKHNMKKIEKALQRRLAQSHRKPQAMTEADLTKEAEGIKNMLGDQKELFIKSKMPDFQY